MRSSSISASSRRSKLRNCSPAFEQGRQLLGLLARSPEQHPQILHGRTAACIVRSTKCGPPWPSSSSGVRMFPGWQSPCRRICVAECKPKWPAAPIQISGWCLLMGRLCRKPAASGCAFGSPDLMFEQIVHGFVAEAFSGSSAGRCAKGRSGTHGVDAGQKAACPFQHLPVVPAQGRRPPPPGTDAEQKPACSCTVCPCSTSGATTGTSRPPTPGRRRALPRSGCGSSGRAVELGDDLSIALVLVGQMDAVLIGAQRRQPSVRHKARAAQRIDHRSPA